MSRLKNFELSMWLEIGIVLAFLASGLTIAIGNEYSVLNWYQTDDAFYYFKVAQNIVEGKGSTFDGVNLTNGYHPLWLIVCLPVFVLARWDLVLPLRVLILVSVGLGAGSAVMLFRLLRRIVEKEIAFLITIVWAFNLSYFKLDTMGGMESGLSAFFIILLWYQVVVTNQGKTVSLRQVLLIGFIAVFTFLSRLDNIFLVFFAGVWVWIRWWKPIGKTDTMYDRWIWRVRIGFAYYFPVTVVLLGYLGLNSLLFGTSMPISSQVKVWWGTLGLTIYGAPLYIYPEYIFEYLLPASRGVGPWSYVTKYIHPIAKDFWAHQRRAFTFEPLVLTYGTIGLVLGAFITPGRKRFFQMSNHLGLLPFFAGCMFQSIYYFWRDAYNLRPWYWISQNLFLLLFLAVFLNVIIGYFRGFKFYRQVLLISSCLFGILAMVNFGSYIAGKTYPDLYATQHYYRQKEQAIRAVIDPGSTISAIGSGSLGYFLPDYRVVNLDGLINSVGYFENLKTGTVIEFLDDMNVSYVIGTEYLVMKARPYAENLADHIEIFTEFELNTTPWMIWKIVTPP